MFAHCGVGSRFFPGLANPPAYNWTPALATDLSQASSTDFPEDWNVILATDWHVCGVGSRRLYSGLEITCNLLCEFKDFNWRSDLVQTTLSGVGSPFRTTGPVAVHCFEPAETTRTTFLIFAIYGVGSRFLTGLLQLFTELCLQFHLHIQPFSLQTQQLDLQHCIIQELDTPSDCSIIELWRDTSEYNSFLLQASFVGPLQALPFSGIDHWNDWLRGGLPISDSHWPDISMYIAAPLLVTIFAFNLIFTLIFGLGGDGFWLLLANLALELSHNFLCACLHSLPRFFESTIFFFLSVFTNHIGYCRSGPKSRHGVAHQTRGFLFGILLLLHLWMQLHRWGEGCDSTMGVTEVHGPTDFSSPFWTKRHGMQPPMCPGTSIRPHTFDGGTQIAKRSLLRAYRRSLLTGSAWYRGRLYSRDDFERMGCRLPLNAAPLDSLTMGLQKDWTNCNQHHAPKRRLKIWQWNCGGLATSRLDEIKAWLVLHQMDIATLVETRWTFDAEWSDDHWHMVHSGEGSDRGKGILVLISRKLASATELRWQHQICGRLLHVRIHVKPRPIDLVTCYQHTYHPTSACLLAREKWWTALEQVLMHIPHRHNLVLLGDFNCHLTESTGVSGTRFFDWRSENRTGLIHSDHARFLHILRNNALVALNAWSASLGPTYVHGDQANRLDFICVRPVFADGEARMPQYLWTSPFLTQTKHGHVPICCTIAKYWIPGYNRPKHQFLTLTQRRQCREAYLAQTPAWCSFVQRTEQQIQNLFSHPASDQSCLIDELHPIVLHTFQDCFPCSAQPRPAPAWQPALPTILSVWDHRRLMLTPKICHLRNIFHCWRHVTRFLSLKRLHRKQARAIRHTRFLEVVQQASQAAERHDTHKLFQLIHSYAPRQPRRQIQIRNHAGQLATPIESDAILNKFVSETWHGPPTNSVQFTQPPGVPFSVSQLADALSRIPTTKATARHCAPGTVWRQQAQFLAPLLYEKLCTWWNYNPPYIPPSWRHGWLLLIPKSGRSPTKPQNLRPLALQEPIGKAVISILINLAVHEAMRQLVLFPIWAYLANRSTMEAIRRVSLHCIEVREFVRAQRSTPHSRANRVPRATLYGGIQLFLDLQRAFDCLNRGKLFQRLHTFNINESLVCLLSTWHENTCYYVQNEMGDTPICTGKGVRQGCKAAPGLWNFFVCMVLQDLMNFVPFEWIQRHITVYADDIHIGATITCMEDLCQTQFFFGALLRVLQDMDMTINPAKSVILLELKGTQSRAARHRFVHRESEQCSFKIDVPGSTSVRIPIHRSAKYLGVIMSYHNFEDDSLKHRISLMKIGFHRLQRWLTGKHGLSKGQRFRLWHTCIYPIFSYGLMATGMTHKGIQLAVTQMTIMMRRILQDHAFFTGRNNSEALASGVFLHPARLLHDTAAGLVRTLEFRRHSLQAQDLAHSITWDHLPALVATLANLQAATSLERPALASVEAQMLPFFQCQACDFCTTDVSALRRHCTVAHGTRMYRTQHVDPADFALDGLPTCKYCGFQFSTWRMFVTHIERGCQAVLIGPAVGPSCIGTVRSWVRSLSASVPDMTQPAPAAARGMRMITSSELQNLKQQAFGPGLLQLIRDRDWEKVADQQDLCRYLSRRCIICAFQFSRCQELHQHYRTQHADLWEFAPQRAIQLTNLYSRECPCNCCGAMFKTHMCPTWSQIAALLVSGAGLTADESLAPPATGHRCDLCLDCFDEPALLVQHLQTAHGLQGLSFNPSRDAIDNEPSCTHCGQIFQTMPGLKSHIVQGRCAFFNPMATSETLDVADSWRSACMNGAFLEVLRSPQTRMRLTITCQACGRACHRAADLAHHLQTSHARLWRISQRLTQILVDVFYQQQCFCNPTLGVKRANHVCLPFRQLAMCFHRLGQHPFAPTVITDQVLHRVLSSDLPPGERYRIEQLLAQRRFSDLWQDLEVQHLLSCTCIFCGRSVPTAELALHIREEHPCDHEMVLFYMDTLLPVVNANNPDDFRCQQCRQIFNLPATMRPDESETERLALAQSHLRTNCPVLLQISVLLASVLNGDLLHHGTTRGWGHSADDGRLRSLGATVSAQGSPTDPGRQSETSQNPPAKRPKQDRRRTSRPGHARGARPVGHAPLDDLGTAGPTTRSGPAKSQADGSIHAFFEPRTQGSSPHLAGRDDHLEAKAGEPIEVDDDATPTAPGSLPAEAASSEGRADSGQPGHGGLVHHVGAEGSDPCGSQFPISSLGLGGSEADAGQEAANQLSEDVSAFGGAGGDDVGPRASGPVSCIAVTPRSAEDHSLAVTAAHAQRQAIRPAVSIGLQLDLDGSGGLNEATYPADVSIGLEASDNGRQAEGQGQGKAQALATAFGQVMGGKLTSEQRARLIQGLCGLALINDSNWCFANCAFYGLLWTFLSHHGTDDMIGGLQFAELVRFILVHSDVTATLTETTWVQQYLPTWGLAQGQQDSAECTQCLMTWLCTTAFDMRWERRLDTTDGIQTVDSSTAHKPIVLTISHSMEHAGHATLSKMISEWHQENSMRAALSEASTCLCLHVDRFYQDLNGSITKSQCSVGLETEALLPVLAEGAKRLDWFGYIPVAGIAHLGGDQDGHCRTVLKLQPTVGTDGHPMNWLLTQDGQGPEPIWGPPAWFLSNLQVVMLVRTDCLQLPALPAQMLHGVTGDMELAQPTSTTDLLSLLSAQVGADVTDGMQPMPTAQDSPSS